MAAKRTAPPPPPPTPNPIPNRRALASGAGSASPSKRMLAFHFLRALSRISSATPVACRTRTIRRAAYFSMARAASPRRSWSRALLRQVRVRRAVRSRRAVLMRRRVVSAAPAPPLGVRSISAGQITSAPLAGAPPPRQAGEPARADALRRLVPGGGEMEYCSLLEETADYVRCLRAQVQLMQGLVDLFSGQ
ncbi:transcription factor IBH1-like [Phragmites australis]|uniref:transcription factor IBH1-like n=1 Tax=Phragmites australis TaxID=29695 RepID=UPI002D765E74|nr:transcription factor IBH1-like [Phragmites australis]